MDVSLSLSLTALDGNGVIDFYEFKNFLLVCLA
jgi:hypothetical protein